MNEIQLDTPITRIEMPDKLRNRLKMLHCNTFQDAMNMTTDDGWDNVSPKVINALKRFQEANTDYYTALKGRKLQVASTPTQSQPNDERRFFVANNILNAYASSGRLFRAKMPIAQMMKEIVEAADAFMDAYYGLDIEPEHQPKQRGTKKEVKAKEHRPAKDTKEVRAEHSTSAEPAPPQLPELIMDMPEPSPAPDMRVTSDNQPEIAQLDTPAYAETDDQSLTSQQLLPAAENDSAYEAAGGTNTQPGQYITLTAYHSERPSTARHFKVGDTLKVEKVRIGKTGAMVVSAVINRHKVTLDSDHYDWEVSYK